MSGSVNLARGVADSAPTLFARLVVELVEASFVEENLLGRLEANTTKIPYKSKPGSRSGDPSVFLHRGVGALFLAPLKTGQLAPPYQPG